MPEVTQERVLDQKSERQVAKSAKRVFAVDALRGFDMFWIVGGAGMVRALAKATNWAPLNWLSVQFSHVEWEGFRFYDWIFPLFLFIVGVSMPFSFEKRLAHGDTKMRIFVHVLKRVAILIFFGMWINGKLLSYDPSQFQITYSVLQAIALGYLVASIAVLTVGVRGQFIAMIAMPMIYWALMMFVPVPGYGAGVVTPEGNFGRYLNDLVLGSLQGRWRFGWIIQIPNWGATALLGVMAGHLLRSARSQKEKLLGLAGAGVACLAIGLVWSLSLPIIKNLWTSSYLFYASGWSYLALAAFYLIIDIWGRQKWAFPFRVIGMNAIAIYVASSVMGFRFVADVFVRGLAQYTGAWFGFIQAAAAFAVGWLILFHMYRHKIFLKV